MLVNPLRPQFKILEIFLYYNIYLSIAFSNMMLLTSDKHNAIVK